MNIHHQNCLKLFFLEISGNGVKTTLVGNIYRPPKLNNKNEIVQRFLNEFFPVLENLSKYRTALLAGDFNLDLLKIGQSEKYAHFLESMLSLGFCPKITLPTRFAKKSASLLDQIFVKCKGVENSISRSGILFSSVSDHLATFTFLQDKVLENKAPKYVKIQTMDSESIAKFVASLT